MALQQSEVETRFPVDLDGLHMYQIAQLAPLTCALSHIAGLSSFEPDPNALPGEGTVRLKPQQFVEGTLSVIPRRDGWTLVHPGLKPNGRLEVGTIMYDTSLVFRQVHIRAAATAIK